MIPTIFQETSRFFCSPLVSGVHTVEAIEMGAVKPEIPSIFLSIILDLTSDHIHENSCVLGVEGEVRGRGITERSTLKKKSVSSGEGIRKKRRHAGTHLLIFFSH